MGPRLLVVALMPLFVSCQGARSSAQSSKNQKKPSSASVCAAKIGATPTPGDVYDDWSSAYKALNGAPPSNNDEAKALLCGGCSDTTPNIAQLGDEASWSYHLVYQLQDGRPLIFAFIGGGMMGRCPFIDELTFDPKDPSRLMVLSEISDMVYVTPKDLPDGTVEMVECIDRKTQECMSACFTGSSTRRDYFIDVTKRAIVLSIEREQTKGADLFWATDISIARDDKRVVIKGGGCDEEFTLP